MCKKICAAAVNTIEYFRCFSCAWVRNELKTSDQIYSGTGSTQILLSLGSVMKPMHLPKPFTTFPPISPLYFLLISIYYRTFWQAAGFGWAVCQQEEGQKPFSNAGEKTTLPTRQLLWKIWKDSRPGDKPLCKLVGTEGVAGICGSNQLHPTLHLLSF